MGNKEDGLDQYDLNDGFIDNEEIKEDFNVIREIDNMFSFSESNYD